MGINCKKKIKIEEDIDHCRTEKGAKRRREEQFENQNFNLMTNVLYTAEEISREKQTYEYRTCPKCKQKCW